MKLISWNVNGLRACMKKGFEPFLEEQSPDIICLQETKMHPEQADFKFDGYHMYWNSAERKGYSGTAIFTKAEPIKVTNGMGMPEHDNEGRVITAEYERFFLVTVYTPNAKRELERLDYRMIWEDIFRGYLAQLKEIKPVIVCGDMNVAHNPIDLKNFKSNIGNAGYTYEERGKMTELLASGFVDTFRYLYPEQEGAYSWWSYMGKARENNTGWRIDYFLVSNGFENQVEESFILPEVLGSDHCPVGIVLK
ncbi:exodeoxyribonuclease III [Scatolibacter rhodanostii]|uniref:exodeoxyribonuclease III n=1 Tax=Scatolibacter rhodanostii TaxID=2014781 RepID=UPI000C088B36|nr:exodeoxyribonuclease III [Scatolibacter rhodanostii]